MELFAWKWMIPPDEWTELPDDPDHTVAGCMAVAVGETEEQAKAAIERYCAEMGFDARWLAVAKIKRRLPIVAGAMLGYAEV